MSSTVEQVKARLGIVEVVSNYLKLEKAGVNWKARCPFHNEKTASFFVSPSRQSYHCFGCNRGGDIISFVEEMEGLDFLGALKVLAERAGVALEPLGSRGENDEKLLLYRVLETARDYYQQELADSPPALDYLRERGLKPETIMSFQLGLAPAGWSNLTQFLKPKGFADENIIKAGLALRREGQSGIYDRFRSRLMFPINDASGRVVGFSGRIFSAEGGPASGGGEGKYINTPETALYSKSKILYGYDKAKTAIRRAGTGIIVEGQMDLLLSHQAGALHTVAVSGTALTTDHLMLIKRLTDNVIMAFDGDAAGVAAAERSLAAGLAAGLMVKVVALPAGRDPADLIHENPEAWPAKLAEAKHVIDFFLDHLAHGAEDKLTLIHQIEAQVYPYLSLLVNPHDREHFIAKVALLTQLPENTVRTALRPKANENPAPVVVSSGKTRQQKIAEQLFSLLYWGQPLAERLEQILGQKAYAEATSELAPRQDELTLGAELSYAGMEPAKLAAVVKELCDNLQLEIWQAEIEAFRFALVRGEPVLPQLQVLYARINDLKNEKK